MNQAIQREADILKNARLRLGYSQLGVAARIGVNIRQYQRFEGGERAISKANLKLGLIVCKVLEIDPYDLVFGDDLQFFYKEK